MLLEVFMLEVIQATFSRQCSLITQKETVHIYFMNQLHEIGSEVFPHQPSESLAQVGENLH